jgi:hypothetical protein
MSHFKTRSATQGNSFIIKFLRPRVIFTSKDNFIWEPFTEVLFHADAGESRCVVPCSFVACKGNFLKAELMASREGEPQKCKGILAILTQTGAGERMLDIGLKEGVPRFHAQTKVSPKPYT